MYPMRNRQQEQPAATTADWAAMVEGVRGNSARAVSEFRERYRSGLTVFFQRRLGAVGLPQLVDQALEGALREMRGGQMTSPADLVHFLRNVLEREQMIRDLNPNRSLSALAGATAHERICREAASIGKVLRSFSGAEQQALRSYYDGEASAEQAAAAAGLSAGQFAALRERLYATVRADALRKAPNRAEAPEERAMAAGSGAG